MRATTPPPLWSLPVQDPQGDYTVRVEVGEKQAAPPPAAKQSMGAWGFADALRGRTITAEPEKKAEDRAAGAEPQ